MGWNIAALALLVTLSSGEATEEVADVIRDKSSELLREAPVPLVSHSFARDFYLMGHGPFAWYSPETVQGMKQTGLYEEFVPGALSLKLLTGPRPGGVVGQTVELCLKHRWPILTIDYEKTRAEERMPKPTGIADRLWIGQGHPEELYRLEMFFYYVRHGKKWRGSSMGHWTEEGVRRFMEEHVLPRVRRELPFFHDPEHRWTRSELRRLCEILVDAYWPDRPPLVWHMTLVPQYLAARQDVRAVGSKGCSAYEVAVARGLLQHAGRQALYMVWLGHEPSDRHYIRSFNNAEVRHWQGRAIGMPAELLTIYYLRPYLSGATILMGEGHPVMLFDDAERDGQYELTRVGRAVHQVIELVHRHPNRGVAFAPIALLLDRDREIGLGASTYGAPFGVSDWYDVPYDEADHMNHGIIWDLLYPEPEGLEDTAGYYRGTPFGELFDIIRPNDRFRTDLHSVLSSYSVAFSLGGLRLTHQLTRELVRYVRAGGTLVVHAPDILKADDPERWRLITGVDVTGRLVEGRTIRGPAGELWREEAPFVFYVGEPVAADVLFECGGRPVVTYHRYGKGQVILVLARYLLQDREVPPRSGPPVLKPLWQQKPLMRLASVLVELVARSASPIWVEVPESQRRNVAWALRRKGADWLVILYNHRLDRTLTAQPVFVAHAYATYPLERTPVRIRTRISSLRRAYEWLTGERAWLERRGSEKRLLVSLPGAAVRVYELSALEVPEPSRRQNLARGKPVTASSSRPGHGPELAVDGDHTWHRFWWSAPDNTGVRAPLPQWLQVDLQGVHRIDHVRVYFHSEPDDGLDGPLRIQRYRVEVSEDGKRWQTVVDETANIHPATPHGEWRWFEPVEARYVRLTVTDNLALSGAQVVEFEVYPYRPGAAYAPTD